MFSPRDDGDALMLQVRQKAPRLGVAVQATLEITELVVSVFLTAVAYSFQLGTRRIAAVFVANCT